MLERRTSLNEIIATAPWAFWAFALGVFSGLMVLIACFAHLGSRVSGVEKNLVGLRDEMRGGYSRCDHQAFGHQCIVFEPGFVSFARFGGSS